MSLSLALRSRLSYLALAATFLVGSMASGTLLYLSVPSEKQVRRGDLDKALEALHGDRDREAQLLAEALLRDPELEYDDLSVPSYVLGIVSVREADLASIPRQRQQLYLIGARYLEQAEATGFPPGEIQEGEYWLAYALKSAGRREDAIHAIEQALASETPHEAELKLLLADAALHEKPRRPDEALELLEGVPSERLIELGPKWTRQAVRTRLDALMVRKDYDGIGSYLATLDSGLLTPPEVRLFECRKTLLEASALAKDGASGQAQASRLAEAANEKLDSIVEADLTYVPDLSERLYLKALALQLSGRDDEAWDHLERVSDLGTSESLPALLDAARLLREAGRDDDGIEVLKRAVGTIGEPEHYANPWLSLDDLRDELMTALEQYRAAEQWAQASAISDLFLPFFERGPAQRLRAETLRGWGDWLAARAEEAAPGDDELLRVEAREKYRSAGAAFADLAEIRFADPEYVQDRLDSGDAFFRGNDFEEAIRQYVACLEYAPRKVEPDATLGIGRALLALGEEQEALTYLTRIETDHPTHPAVYAARYWAALAFLEIGDLDAAASRLEINLYESELTPDSRDWRDSLFEFGDVQYRKGLAIKAKVLDSPTVRTAEDEKLRQRLIADSEDALMRAIRTYEEAAVRFPDDDRNLETRYALGVAWRTLAQTPRDEFARTDIEITKAALVQKMKDRLTASLPWYEGIYRELIGAKDDGSLDARESALLRNVTFAKADVLYDLGRYQQAIEGYASASNQYHNQPEALEALVQMARCYRDLEMIEEARGKIAQAKDLLARMPDDTDFAKTTRGTRAEWVAALELLGQF